MFELCYSEHELCQHCLCIQLALSFLLFLLYSLSQCQNEDFVDCVLTSLVEVNSQTFPYVSFMGQTLANHSYVNLNLVGRPDGGGPSVECHIDLTTCCNPTHGVHHGGISLMELYCHFLEVLAFLSLMSLVSEVKVLFSDFKVLQ